MIDKETEKGLQDIANELKEKKLYKIHADIEIQGQFYVKYIPISLSVFASSEEEAQNIARNTKCIVSSLGKTKIEYDFTKQK